MVAEETDKQEKPRVSRRASMRTAAMSVSSKKLSPPSQRRIGVNRRNFEADEELDKEEEQQDKKHEDSDKEKSAESDKEEHDEYINEENKVDDKAEAEAEAEPEEEEEEQEEKADSKSPEPFADPSQMTEQENPVRRNVIKNLTTILKTIIESALVDNPDMYDNEKEKLSPEERANSLAKLIENTMLQELGDMVKGQRHRTCGERYKSKFRSLLHNLKDKANKVFQLRVITGDLEPSELVKMSSEDMANPELKSMSELLREKGLKNSVMKLENVPIIKKTHKGDIIMVPNEPNEERSMYSEQVQRELDKIDTKSQSPVTEERKVINSFSPTASTNNGKMDPLDDILARIGIPNNEETNGKRSSIASAETTDQEAKKRKIALDVEQLLGEEEDTPFEVDEVDINELAEQDEDEQEEDSKTEAMEVDGQHGELPTIWNGRVNMPQVAEFEASARQIGGRQLADEEWSEVLSPTMWIEGRIPTDRVTNYITQTQYSTSREIILIEIQAQGADTNQQSQTLLQYLDSRQRYAVVGHNKTKIKDFYLIPLYKTKQIPDCLYVVRLEERKRDCDLFLGVLVLSKQHSTPTITTSLPQQKTSNSLPPESSPGPITIPPSLSSISIPPQLQYAISQISALQQQQPPSLTVQQQQQHQQQQHQQQQQQNPYNYPQPAQVHHTHTHNVHSHNIPSQSHHHQQQHHRQNHQYQRHHYRQDDHHRNRYQNDHRPSY
ncbi:transcription factor S-II, central domain-containing protein [Choanephora cucurbitarum]|nr:transcription factor S-II, central domain-containing protein [Choanephora cucurbitarum]